MRYETVPKLYSSVSPSRDKYSLSGANDPWRYYSPIKAERVIQGDTAAGVVFSSQGIVASTSATQKTDAHPTGLRLSSSILG